MGKAVMARARQSHKLGHSIGEGRNGEIRFLWAGVF